MAIWPEREIQGDSGTPADAASPAANLPHRIVSGSNIVGDSFGDVFLPVPPDEHAPDSADS
jgi:hypothetical protein